MKTRNSQSVAASESNSESNVAAFTETPGVCEFGFRKFSANCLQILSALKGRVTADLVKEFAGVLDSQLLLLAVNEADSLAATTPFRALFLPALAEENVRNVSAWQRRQEAIHER